MLKAPAVAYRPRREHWGYVVAAAMALGALCPSASALEGVDRPEVQVDQFRLEPLANYVTSTGRSEIHPKGLLGFGFDSNVYATPEDEVADGYIRALAGVEGRLYPGILDLVVYDLELDSKIYFSESDRNFIGGRFDGEWAHEGVDAASSVKFKWTRSDDPLVETGQRIQHSEYLATAEYGQQGYYGQWIGELRLGREVFEEDGTDFTKEERSSWNARIGGGLTWLFSRTGEIRGETYLGTRIYDEDGRYNDSWRLGALAVWQGRIGDKSVLSAAGGLEGRFYEDDFLGQSAYDDQIVVLPVGTVNLRWQYRPFSRVDTKIYSDVQDSGTANAAWIYGIQSEWLHAYDERWRYGGLVNYYRVINSGAGAGATLDERSVFRIAALCELELVRGIGGRARLGYTTSEATVSNDFDRLEFMLEAAIAF